MESLSEDLQDLIVRDAFVRRRRDELAVEVETRRLALAERDSRRPAWLFLRGREAKREHELATQQLRTELAELQRSKSTCDVIVQKCDKIIVDALRQHLEEESTRFRDAVEAQRLVPEWEDAIGLYRATLKRFIMNLGIARNQMGSGYDRAAGTYAPGTLAAFTSALTAARTLEAEMAIPNQIAKRHRALQGLESIASVVVGFKFATLPPIENPGIAARVAALRTMKLENAQTQIGALIEESERMFDVALPQMLDELARVRATDRALHEHNISQPLAEIRAMADEEVDSTQVEAVVASMAARFVHLVG